VWNDSSAPHPLPSREARALQEPPEPQVGGLRAGGLGLCHTEQDPLASEGLPRQRHPVLWKAAAAAF